MNCTNCKNNAGDVCIGYGILPGADFDVDETTYSKNISELRKLLGDDVCDDFEEKEE